MAISKDRYLQITGTILVLLVIALIVQLFVLFG